MRTERDGHRHPREQFRTPRYQAFPVALSLTSVAGGPAPPSEEEAAAMRTSNLLKSMTIRAARTFVHTFVAVLLASPVLSLAGPALKAAALAGVASVLSMLNRLLDETPVPSLPEPAAPAPPAAASAASAPSAVAALAAAPAPSGTS